MDPFSLLLLAQSAVSAIRSGCEMLQQGKAVIDEFRDEAESTVSQVRETIETVTGLWDWAKGLWNQLIGVKEPVVSEPIKLEAPKPEIKKSKSPVQELSYEEYKSKAIHDVCQHLKVYFEAQRQLKIHCRELEEQSLTTDKVADSAIDRIEIETQLVALSTQIREAMSWTPEYLGLQDMYKRFLQMYDLILEEQEFDRQIKIRKARYEKWQRESRRNFRIDVAMWMVAIAIVISIWWSVMLQIAKQNGFSLG
jgi:hypothetical protein